MLELNSVFRNIYLIDLKIKHFYLLMKKGSGKKKASPKKESPARIDLSAGKGNDPKQDVLNRFLAETQKIKDNHESHQQEA